MPRIVFLLAFFVLLVACGTEVTATAEPVIQVPVAEIATDGLAKCISVLAYMAANHHHRVTVSTYSSGNPSYPGDSGISNISGSGSGATTSTRLSGQRDYAVVVELLNDNCADFADSEMLGILKAE